MLHKTTRSARRCHPRRRDAQVIIKANKRNNARQSQPSMGQAHLLHVIQQGFSACKQPTLAACRLPQTTPSTPTNSSHRPQSQLTPRPTILNGTTMKTPIANKQRLLLANPAMKMTDGTLRLRAWAAENRCQPPPHRLRQSPAPSHDQQKAAPFARRQDTGMEET